MPFTKEQYQEYYQKIKEERNRKRREEYLARKSQVDEKIKTKEIWVDEKEKVSKVDENSLSRVDKTVRPVTKENVQLFTQSSELWSDYYSAKKPTCPTCQQKGIGNDKYRFCSEELITPQEYKCLVKHFAVYQGKNFLRQQKELVANTIANNKAADNFVQPEVVANQAGQIAQPSIPEKNEVETAQLAPEKIIREDERFITYARRLWDKKYQKYVYYSCADSCWNGKYCSNCSD